tara:strand:- start:287 stop:418 length:132 start_codon:yes stop_codon:yes gene_type:complete
LSKHPQREGGIPRGYWRGDPPERLNRGEVSMKIYRVPPYLHVN